MNLFFLHLPPKNRKYEPDEHTMVTAYKRPDNTVEGSEFLDDAIRIKDQPLVFGEDSASAEYNEILL